MPFPRLPGRRVTALLAAAACTSAVLAVCGPAATAAPGAGAGAGAVASPTITEPAAGSHGFPFQASETMPNPTLIRTDLRVPTFVVLTETDMTLHVTARQPDSATVHTWELAGTSHADQWLLTTGQPVYERMFGKPVPPRDCGADTPPINDGPAHYSLNAALSAVNRWMRGGPAPATGTILSMQGNTPVRDPATGLARGGIRLPDVAVPTRTLTGQRFTEGAAALFCGLFGATDPWNGDADPWDTHNAGDPSNPTAPQTAEPVLRQLYPTHADYVNKVRASAWTSVFRGFLTPADARTIVTAAQNSTVGG
ncbi:hypothetical protein BBK14_28610 [Parafrankia soli]|uniref:Alpha/beta hydrolase domain-containing protein n=1 Tax=Parafrankia soli TaxID=2599596 RepID=A0A1S1PEW6_9ACTN|nr:alpha/beta hydrolase domain-containing protein [Parafrankia soli]OHV19787.1 hypothetical protein BBK14_28610 [Parafrankia soli]